MKERKKANKERGKQKTKLTEKSGRERKGGKMKEV